MSENSDNVQIISGTNDLSQMNDSLKYDLNVPKIFD